VSAAEAEYQAFIRANLKRNYAGHYLHGMLGMTGFRLLNAPTFVPAYLMAMSGSPAIVGLGLALQQVGQVVSPMLGAANIEHRKKVLPVATLLGTLMRIPILLMAVAGWTLHGQWLLITFIAMLLLMGLAQGAQRVVFQMLMAKVIPVDMRGRLQAFRNFTGGIIAAGLSWFAGKYLVEHNAFGNGYSTTFLIAFVLTSLGLTALRMLMKEPEPPTVRTKARLRDRARDMHGLITADKDYRNFLVAQAFAMGSRLAAPFYILYAGKTVHMTGAALGAFSLAYLGADTVSNLVWGYFGDKSGFRSSFVAALSIGLLSLLLLLNSHTFWPFVLAMTGFGAAASGYLMSSQTMVLEFGAREDTAMRLAISSTVEGAGMTAGPLIGGLIAQMAGYPSVFLAAMALQSVALVILIFGVKEPRLRRKAVQEEPEGPSLG
jgi:MFS family permease